MCGAIANWRCVAKETACKVIILEGGVDGERGEMKQALSAAAAVTCDARAEVQRRSRRVPVMAEERMCLEN